MASIMGANFDVNEIVTNIMEFKSKGLERLNDKKALFDYQRRSYTELKKQLTELKTELDSLKSALNQNNYTSKSGNEAILSVATSSGQITSGQYNVDVTQVAASHKISSKAFASNSEALGLSGGLDISIDNETLNLSVNATDSLANIRDKINASENNPGLTANILKVSDVNGEDEYRLVLTSNETGEAHEITIGGALAADIDLTTTLSSAQNAKFTFNGFSVERSSNTISDLLEGVTFHLNGTTGATHFSIEKDNAADDIRISESFESFIGKYNKIMGDLSKNQSEGLLRDGTYSLIQMNLLNLAQNTYGTADINHLMDVGIKTARTTVSSNSDGNEYAIKGQLDFDMAAFKEALSANKEGLKSFFNNAGDGFITAVDHMVDTLESNTIASREKLIGEQERRLDDRIYREELRLDSQRTQLIDQYSAVQKIIARYDNLSNYLDQQMSVMYGKKS